MAKGTINTRVRADAKEFKAEMKAVAGAIENISKQLNTSNKSFGLFNKNIKGTMADLAHLSQAASGLKGAFDIFKGYASDFIKTADAINTMNARLKQTTTSAGHFTALRAEIGKIAKSTYSSSESIANLFINLNQGLSEMGLSGKQALKMAKSPKNGKQNTKVKHI